MDPIWLQTSRSISGVFGLSINLNENSNTVRPVHSIQASQNQTGHLRYASMPNEILCTENLTPWIKLLPCGKSRGLAQLFSTTHRLIESHYFMANLHFKKVCNVSSILLTKKISPLTFFKQIHFHKKDEIRCDSYRFKLTQTLTVVYNTELATKQRVPENIEWTLDSIFKKRLTNTCPAANSSNVFIRQGKNGVKKAFKFLYLNSFIQC